MKKFSEYSFRDPSFRLGDIGTFKCELIDALASSLDAFLYGDGDESETTPEHKRIIAFLYGIRTEAAEIDDLMNQLDRELWEMGGGEYPAWKKDEPQTAAVTAAERIDQIERGEVDMTVSELEKISNGLQCSPLAIMNGEETAFAIMTAPGMEEPMQQLADLKKRGADMNKIVAAMVREYEDNQDHVTA